MGCARNTMCFSFKASPRCAIACHQKEDHKWGSRHPKLPHIRGSAGSPCRTPRQAGRAYCRGQEGHRWDRLDAEVQHLRKCERR